MSDTPTPRTDEVDALPYGNVKVMGELARTLERELNAVNRKIQVFGKALEIAEKINESQTEKQVELSASFHEAMAYATLETVKRERDKLREFVERISKASIMKTWSAGEVIDSGFIDEAKELLESLK